MTDTIDLSAYFARIGYAGGGAPTLDTLAALHLRHTEAIAFENLNPVLGWPVDLDPKALVKKLVGEGRGGYCYEQNLLFGQVLTALGFRVTGLAGRVRWNTPDCVMTPRSHMLLRVDLDAHSHIVDVGFGVQTPTMPLRLETNVAQTTPHGRFRLIKAGDGFMLEAEVDRAWKNLYWFDVQEQLRPDYELFNYYFSTHPSSVFVTDLIAARPAPGRRHVLFNNRYTVRYVDGPVEQRSLTSAVELGEVLRTEFHLKLPVGPRLDALLERVAQSSKRDGLSEIETSHVREVHP